MPLRKPMAKSLRLSMLLGIALGGAMLGAGPASAQSDECSGIGKALQERAALVSQAQKFGKKTAPATACSVFTKLVSNGNAVIPQIEKNGAWCHVPDNILPAIKNQHAQLSKVRGQACNVAAQQQKMERQARQNAGRQNQEPWGGTGDVLGGPLKVPKGAL